MNKKFLSSLNGGTSLASAAVLALAVLFNPVSGQAAESRYIPAAGPALPKAVPPVQPDAPSPAITFEQRVMAGLLDMMAEDERNSIPVARWKKMLPAIISHGQYVLVPKSIEAQIPVDFYHSEPFRIAGNMTASNLVEGLISTGQLSEAREEVRHSIKPALLTRAGSNGYTLMVEIFRNGEWKSLSGETRQDLASDLDMWLKPIAIYPVDEMMQSRMAGIRQETMPLIAIALRYDSYGDVPANITKEMVSHPQWQKIKGHFLWSAAEKGALQNFTPDMWNTYENENFTRRYAGSNVIDLAAQMGQAHLIPGRFWVSLGVGSFTVPHPRLQVAPLYFIARSTSARILDGEQKSVLQQATKADWFADFRSREGDSAVWKKLTREEIMQVQNNKDEENDQDDGLRLGDWISNAGKIDLVQDRLTPADIATLAPKGSLGEQPADWAARSPLFRALVRGSLEDTKWEARAQDNYVAAMESLFRDSMLGDMDNNFSPIFWAAVNKADGLIGEKVWSSLTHDDVRKYQYKGGYSLADLLANAGQADKVKHLLNSHEIAKLPKPGSIGADPSSWLEVKALEQELQKGIVLKDKWLEKNPYGRTYLHAYLRNVPAFEMVKKLLPNFSLSDLMIRDEKNEFALLTAADNGFLKYLSPRTWNEVILNPAAMTDQGAAGRSVLNIAANNISHMQLRDIPRDVLAAIPRSGYFQRDDLGGFPFHWAHFTGQEDFLPWKTGIFKPHDMMIVAPSKADSFTHVSIREEKMKLAGTLKAGEPGPISKMLSRFPFESWRVADATKDTALLQLARNGGLQRMPYEEFRSKITSKDLEASGRYSDTVLYWLSSNLYPVVDGNQVIWHPALDLVRPEAVDAVKPFVWTMRVRQAEQDDFELNDNTRNALEKGGFALLGMVSSGYLPPAGFEWTEEAYTVQDALGNDVTRELYRQRKFTLDRVHDLARLGLLDKNKIPPYVIVDINSGLKTNDERLETWLYTPEGKLNSIFAEAAYNGLAEALDWGDARQTVRRAISVESWYQKGVEGKIPAVEMIRHGKMYEIPADYLYDSPRMWTPELLRDVYNPDNWALSGAENMLHLWTQQISFIADELANVPNDIAAAKSEEDKTRLQDYFEMLKSRDATYKKFQDQFDRNYKQAANSETPTVQPEAGPGFR